MEFIEERTRKFPSGATLFAAYASTSATFTLLQQAYIQFVPRVVRDYTSHFFLQLFTRKPLLPPNLLKLIIEDDGVHTNNIFDACQIYLCNRLSDSANVLKVTRTPQDETTKFTLAEGVEFSDNFKGINLRWSFHHIASPSRGDYGEIHPAKRHKNSTSSENSYFSLTFDKQHKKRICTSYLSFVMETSKDIVREQKTLKLFDCNSRYYSGSGAKSSVTMNHPFTFDSLAIAPEIKKAIMDDLDKFLKRKEFYRRVGKPWKRGYLLYGPPGTGKSSLIAAMANYLKFDVFDLQLGNITDTSLKSFLLMIPSRSIIVIEDIDCTKGLPKRELQFTHRESQMSLAALLNFVDGLWSCCGDERLIVFTTNHKEKLDPALLRPGRMDMHIHMSYLTMPGFKILAYNYLGISTDHQLFGEIESLLKGVNASPAEVAEELMRSEDADVALQGVVELLKKKAAEEPKLKASSKVEEELLKSESADMAVQGAA